MEAADPEAVFGPRARSTDSGLLAAVELIPDHDVPAVRVALLRRIAESSLGTAESTHGKLRTALAGRGILLEPDDVALELALCRFAMDLGFGITLSWRRLSLLDSALDDLERVASEAAMPELVKEVELLADLLVNETIALDAGSADRRLRLVAFLARTAGDRLPALAFDPADPFGERMGALVQTDDALARALASLMPLAAGASKARPNGHRRALIAEISSVSPAAAAVRDAVQRTAHQLLVAPLQVRGPGFVAIRPTNQLLARAAIWLIPALLPGSAPDLLGELGLRLGSSGKRDNQARDTALANTCAALLGEVADGRSVASLARMRTRVRNKPVLKGVEKALVAASERAGVGVEAMVEDSLPSFGLEADGRRSIAVGTWTAEIAVDEQARVSVSWRAADGAHRQDAPRDLREAFASDVQDVADVASDLRGALRDERVRLERLLVESRRWPIDEWRSRFLDHPLRAIHARRLIWRFRGASGTVDGLPGSVRPPADPTVELWHPIESAAATDIESWRDVLVERRIVQPFKQAYRETYRAASEPDAVLDARFADRPLAYGQMRALMGQRGWTAPMLGPHDQGDRAVAFRNFPTAGLRAEFGHVPAGLAEPAERVAYGRSGSLRFTIQDGDVRRPMLLKQVPPRLLSEVLRDVDLFISVPDPTRRPLSDDGDSAVVAARAAALRRILPTLTFRHHISVVGVWLRVGKGRGAWTISLADGTTLRLPEEDEVEIPLEDESGSDAPALYLPVADDPVLERVLATAAKLLE